MHIRNELSQASPSFFEKKGKESEGLKKTDHVKDLFNHQPKEDKERRSARLHLSNASRQLAVESKKGLQQLIKEHPDVGKALEKIPLPFDGEEQRQANHGSDIYGLERKLRTYLQWLKIEEAGGKNLPGSDEEVPYREVHALEKDDLLKQLHEENGRRTEKIRADRQKHAPNYYYMLYPETYAFN